MMTPYECIKLIDNCKYETAGEDVEFYIEKHESGEVVVAFQGSNSSKDWINNFLFWKNTYRDGDITFRAHHGYLKCWLSVKEMIEARIKELNPTSLTITGHSFGGAISVLCYENVKRAFGNIPAQLITFGSPRVLGYKNWKKLKSRFDGARQFRNCSDLVTCLPPWIFFYHHVVKRTVIGDNPNIFNLFKVAVQHDPPWYVERLETIVK